jgi:protein O-GlcNAc transferase
MGDIHHFAWRARNASHSRYIHARDEQRFGRWAPRQCDTEECVEAHTNVDVVVDVPALRALLASRLPLVYAGASVADAALPWPDRD